MSAVFFFLVSLDRTNLPMKKPSVWRMWIVGAVHGRYWDIRLYNYHDGSLLLSRTHERTCICNEYYGRLIAPVTNAQLCNSELVQ